ncbi:DUF6526 family protein [Paenibacillus sp. OAS669]|uniref:DUF6526 family protein n=1 Tax=Paenibacillus sp. OAS669 TaxID=2663821 RepID=UPI001788F1D4|nr:DUF6526 family protein [Paenibacillus sp. OAS669]MBE1442286.1 hypothetical protein [Paenibacillus sp. OAS669]
MPQEQNYHNHKRVHPLFHFIGAPLALITLIGSVVYLITSFSWVSVLTVLASIGLLVTVILTRTYAAKLQDRIIRGEENFRHYLLTGKPLNPRLTIRQIVALRFAGDEQFPALCEQAVNKSLTPADIKKAITQWRGDFYRV